MGREEWHRAWTSALDELETDVEEVESLLTDDHRMRDHALANAWQPPQGLGQLPLDLRPRADAILSRQLAAAQAVATALTTTRRQAALANRIEAGSQGAARPAYIDCAM